MNPYKEFKEVTTDSFIIRVVQEKDSEDLFECYHDKSAVQRMNDDNCDFGFYVETKEKMKETIGYWVDFYQKGFFIRFAIVEKQSGKAVGTIEGFGGETGVLRVDITSAYEQKKYLKEIFQFAEEHFQEYFGNQILVTKAISEAAERRQALMEKGWEYIDKYREYQDYYKIQLWKEGDRMNTIVETERMKLYPLSNAEIKALITAEEDPGMKQAYSEMLTGCEEKPEQRIWFAVWNMQLKDGTDRNIGDFSFKGLNENGMVEIGYGIKPEFEGKGYMTEAVTAISAWASKQEGVHLVEAETEPDNKASQRVLEKSGYLPNGVMGAEGPRFLYQPR